MRIALALAFAAIALFLDLNVGGFGSRIVPQYHEFLRRVPPPLRLIWTLIVLIVGIVFVASTISLSTVIAWNRSPVALVVGLLLTLGGLAVLISGFINKNR